MEMEKFNQQTDVSEKFKEFKTNMLKNKISYDEWYSFYKLWQEEFNTYTRHFSYVEDAIYLIHARLLPFASQEQYNKYLEELECLNIFLQEYKAGLYSLDGNDEVKIKK